ncbi:hypothetical protein CROQUDRAFT_94637 [Cronartium quercuum f. sp. fusiforme G11]|uniref:Uncharacterized protein n=1 Tax=Cronartium quercuum f. sp. fusiforme G11 TaxID=708437 RepID=A0A9P6NDP6_9BASI|nr:hypothetical protein CROQUDRAFT_94637 [Cronartium quercuum f. sp. fusiforme G11]
MGSPQEPVDDNFFEFAIPSNSRSVPDLNRSRRSRETSYTPPVGDSRRRRGLVLGDREILGAQLTPGNNMTPQPTKDRWLRRQYSDCWWASNSKADEFDDLSKYNLDKHRQSPSPSPSPDFCSTEGSPRDMCYPARYASSSPTEACYGTFASRKSLQLRTPSKAVEKLYYNDPPPPPPRCALPPVPPSMEHIQTVTNETSGRSAIKRVSSALSKVLDTHKPASPQRPRYLRRPISFLTPEPQQKASLASSVPTLSSDLSPKKASRSCITPDLKRTGNATLHSFVRPKLDTPKPPALGRRWNLSAGHHLRSRSPQLAQNIGRRPPTAGSLDDPFKADPVVVQRSQRSPQPAMSPAEEQAQSHIHLTERNLVSESSEGSTNGSTPPSSVAQSCPSTDSCSHEIDVEDTKLALKKPRGDRIVESEHQPASSAETFIFAPLRRLDGFFHSHPRRRMVVPNGAFSLRICPGPSNTTFEPGKRLRLNLLPGHVHFDEIRVALIGTASYRGGRDVHEFLRLERIVDKETEEIELSIPLRRSCRCSECKVANGILPGSVVNQEVRV